MTKSKELCVYIYIVLSQFPIRHLKDEMDDETSSGKKTNRSSFFHSDWDILLSVVEILRTAEKLKIHAYVMQSKP